MDEVPLQLAQDQAARWRPRPTCRTRCSRRRWARRSRRCDPPTGARPVRVRAPPGRSRRARPGRRQRDLLDFSEFPSMTMRTQVLLHCPHWQIPLLCEPMRWIFPAAAAAVRALLRSGGARRRTPLHRSLARARLASGQGKQTPVFAKITDESKIFPQVFFRFGPASPYEKPVDMKQVRGQKNQWGANLPAPPGNVSSTTSRPTTSSATGRRAPASPTVLSASTSDRCRRPRSSPRFPLPALRGPPPRQAEGVCGPGSSRDRAGPLDRRPGGQPARCPRDGAGHRRGDADRRRGGALLHRGSEECARPCRGRRTPRGDRRGRRSARRRRRGRGCGGAPGPVLEMALVVQKYGGTSVGDLERIRNVARRRAGRAQGRERRGGGGERWRARRTACSGSPVRSRSGPASASRTWWCPPARQVFGWGSSRWPSRR